MTSFICCRFASTEDQILDDLSYTFKELKLSRSIGSVMHVLEEVGLYGALLCLVAILGPATSNLYSGPPSNVADSSEEVAGEADHSKRDSPVACFL